MANCKGRTALLVDDDAPVRRYVTTVLRREGFDVLEACDGADALSLLHEIQGAVDVLVTDVEMPQMNGTDLVRAARVCFPGIPVLYVSGPCLKEDLHCPQDRVAFLQRPFPPQAVLEAIRGIATMAVL